MQIKLIQNEDGTPEWMLLEMQGAFEFESDVSGKKLGHFAWRKDSTACLIIGHQLLEGQLATLERPFLIINKTDLRDVPTHGQKFSDEVAVKECDIAGIIRRKIVFKDRPKPIVTNAAANV